MHQAMTNGEGETRSMSLKAIVTTLVTGIGLTAVAMPAARAETLNIGYIGSLTGGAAQYGLAGQEGLKIMADDVNAKGGIQVGDKKYQIKIVPYDDQQKAAQAVAAYQRLTSVDGVKYIFTQNSPSTLAIKPNVESDKILMLTAAFSPKAVDADTKYVYRLYMTGENFSPALVKWMGSHLKERRVVTMNPNDETGWGFSKTLEKLFTENGFTVVGSELYERAQNDFSPVLTKIVAQNPDLIDFGSTTPGTAGLIARQARELGYKGRFVQTGGPGWDTIVAAAGKTAAEGMITILFADPANAEYQRIVAAYQKNQGQLPNELIVNFYDAGNVLLKAIQLAGTADDTTKVGDAISKVLPMKSVQGETLTAAPHQILSVDYVAEIKDGKPTVIGTITQ